MNGDVTIYGPPSKRHVRPPKLAVLLESDAGLIECASDAELEDKEVRRALQHLVQVCEFRLAETEPEVRVGFAPDGTPDVREDR